MNKIEALRVLGLHIRRHNAPLNEEDIIDSYREKALKFHPYNNDVDSMRQYNDANHAFSELMKIPSFKAGYRYLGDGVRQVPGSLQHPLNEVVFLDYPAGILESGIILQPDIYNNRKISEKDHYHYKLIRLKTEIPCDMFYLTDGAFLGTFADNEWRIVLGRDIKTNLVSKVLDKRKRQGPVKYQYDIPVEVDYFGPETESFLLSRLLHDVYGQEDWVDIGHSWNEGSFKRARETAVGGLEISVRQRNDKYFPDFDIHAVVPKRPYDIMKVLHEARFGKPLKNLAGKAEFSEKEQECIYEVITTVDSLILEGNYKDAEVMLRELQDEYRFSPAFSKSEYSPPSQTVDESLLKCYKGLGDPIGIITTIQRMRQTSPAILRKGLVYQMADAFAEINEPEIASFWFDKCIGNYFLDSYDRESDYPAGVNISKAYSRSLAWTINHLKGSDRKKAYEFIDEILPESYPAPNSGWKKMRPPSTTEYFCHLHRGLLLFEDRRYEESLGDLEIAAMYAQSSCLRIDEQDSCLTTSGQEADIRLKLGLAYQHSGKPDAAKEQYLKVIELYPSCDEARKLLDSIPEQNVVSLNRVKV